MNVTYAGELLSAEDALPYPQCVKVISGEMPVEGGEFQAVAGRVTENDDWPVVQWRGIDREGMDDTFERRVDWSACLGE